MIELVKNRQETNKTFRLDDGRRQLIASTGPIHYKDNYASDKLWKDIDLTWQGNRITKAPYELTRDGNKYTIRNKKTGELSTIELLTPSPDFEVVPDFSSVKFRHTITSIPFETRFKVTGQFRTMAYDDVGELELKTTLADGILTEKITSVKDKRTGKARPSFGLIRVDPTWQVGTPEDDVAAYTGSTGFSTSTAWFMPGHSNNSANLFMGAAARLRNVTIPSGATIDSAVLRLTSQATLSITTVNTYIDGDDADSSVTITSIGDWNGRARTTAKVAWDSIDPWTLDVVYDSPDIKPVIQEIVDRPGWNSGQNMNIFHSDYEDQRSSSNARRGAYTYNANSAKSPQLVVTYTVPVVNPTVTIQSFTDITDSTATGNGNITNTGGEDCDLRGIVWDLASQGAPGDVAPGASGYATNVQESGTFGTGAFTRSLTGLPSGDVIYGRAWAHNSAGYAYSDEVSFSTSELTNAVWDFFTYG